MANVMANAKEIKKMIAKRFGERNTDNQTLLSDMKKFLTPIYFRDLNKEMMTGIIKELVRIGRKDILKEITTEENDIIIGYYIKEKDMGLV